MRCPKCKTHQSPKEICGWCGAPLGRMTAAYPHESSTAAKPIGTCHKCGGTLYEFLVHHCSTAVRFTTQQGGFRQTPWGTWEWRPW